MTEIKPQQPSTPEIFADEILSPCNKGCPAHINISGYIALILEGRELDAYRLIRNNNPFPAVTGRVCPHPCEKACRRLDFDKSVSICVLKAFAADKVQNLPEHLPETTLPEKGKSVGIIGSGPSGLTCAYFLRKLGYDVTVYEAQPIPGGMIAMGIPEFRIPMQLLLWEIEQIQRIGVKIILNTKVGKDISFQDLEKRYNAVYIALGLPLGSAVKIEGDTAPGFTDAVDFLREVKLGLHLKKPLPKVGKNVVVLGGGNVAVDVVRTVKRLGAESVRMFCIEQRKEMPAWESEIEDALAEGICLDNGWGPERLILDKKGAVKGIEFKECTRVFDEQGKFSPQYCVDDKNTVQADMVIRAFGQAPDIGAIKGVDGFKYFRERWLIADSITRATGRAGVFAGGDMVKPGLLIDAIADGRQAAKAIDLYLGGTGKLNIDTSISLPFPHLNWVPRPITRVENRYIDEKERQTGFNEVMLPMTLADALHECERCICCEPPKINLDKCMGCGMCVQSCPYEAISFTITQKQDIFGDYKVRKANVDPTKCHTCAVCFTECPINAIQMTKWGDSAYLKEISAPMEVQK